MNLWTIGTFRYQKLPIVKAQANVVIKDARYGPPNYREVPTNHGMSETQEACELWFRRNSSTHSPNDFNLKIESESAKRVKEATEDNKQIFKEVEEARVMSIDVPIFCPYNCEMQSDSCYYIRTCWVTQLVDVERLEELTAVIKNI